MSVLSRTGYVALEWNGCSLGCLAPAMKLVSAAWHRCNGPAVLDRQFGLVTQPSRVMRWHRRASPTAFLLVCRYSKVSMQDNPIVREHAQRSSAISQTFKD